jgi:uncharacterized membrane protein YeaQ/YmgE (transglycosylase-associated protein family)
MNLRFIQLGTLFIGAAVTGLIARALDPIAYSDFRAIAAGIVGAFIVAMGWVLLSPRKKGRGRGDRTFHC